MDDHPHHQSMATPAAASMSSSKSKTKLQGGGERSSRGSGGGNSPPAAMRKGPWTEEEDAQLVWFVRLFGERRWDFLAKVSGLRRTGKSCRLRWVNYLHPGLRCGRITADEERLILQLHAQWGSRWSRIARSLPGRTDNEIKNFWRTRARKQKAAAAAQQQQQNSRSSKTASASAFSGSSSSVTATTSSCSGSPSPSSGSCGTATSSSAVTVSALRQSSGSGDDDAEFDEASTTTAASQHQHHHHQQQQQECYASDHFWNDIAAAEAASYMLIDGWAGAGPGHPAEPPSSPAWEYCSDYSLWRIDDDEYYKKMLDSS
ncbi:unnamed protein product [Miscanthus lutarioriparius]|uniref:Uncharacterized protein n=1 Tax=Miscanthus lutarioriparius TaxID=422564 RepID=A0A811RU00_9POAL|nr:unnamed protein product [Miscanthus lutarioriparius]